ncbi:hypothetical protein [Streptosporangium lutulentum]|uniref:Diketogulonate reductase-like aldo/keto reductase n=1 Tax=Streptosporangium lutulentum TaxID=1461250 RepID=A0ABT9QC71_9ACTN|nr:hypothetical protein [Streptosporangium lutulentum]MDP9843649.1 diketogulonate reductase-like aldo/keto reductase [Streptosporangium lutulentum]
MQSVTLDNGLEMPLLGFGVFQIPPDETEPSPTRRPPPAHPAADRGDVTSADAGRMADDLDVFGFELTDDQMARIAAPDTGSSLDFDHRDPAIAGRLGTRRVD